MLILPAIDLRDGRCVRLTQGDFDREAVYSEEPSVVAREFELQGAKWLHVVDLDGAREGAPRNAEILKGILDIVSIPVQFGGGIRSMDSASSIVGLGVARVIVGTSLVVNESVARELFGHFGDRAVAGIDVREGKVAVSGWKEETELSAIQAARLAESFGAKRIVVTDIAKDGTLEGPSLSLIQSVLAAVGVPVIASGGVSSLGDIAALATLEVLGLEGAIVGKALYEGRFSFSQALSAAC